MPQTTGNQKRSVGRPRLPVAPEQVNELRRQGLSFRKIAREMGVGYGTVRRVHLGSGTASLQTGPSGDVKS